MIPISGDEIIVGPGCGHRADHDGFLADIEMAKSADLLRLILLAGALFKAPDQQHQREHLDFVALSCWLHQDYAGWATAARARRPSSCWTRRTQRTKRVVKKRSLTSELRKNIQLGVALY